MTTTKYYELCIEGKTIFGKPYATTIKYDETQKDLLEQDISKWKAKENISSIILKICENVVDNEPKL